MGAAKDLVPKRRMCTRLSPREDIYILTPVRGREFVVSRYDPRFSALDKWDELIPPEEHPVEVEESKGYGLLVAGLEVEAVHVEPGNHRLLQFAPVEAVTLVGEGPR
jgi:hypothetical protein